MAEIATITGDVRVDGNFAAKTFTLPAGTVTDNAVLAATGIQATKLQHQYENTYAQPAASSAAVERKLIHWVKGATATIVEFRVGVSTAMIGAATATIDLKKNGSTILTASITLDNGTAAFAIKNPAGFTSTALVLGDFLEVDVTAAAAGGGTLGKGLSAVLVVREDAA